MTHKVFFGSLLGLGFVLACQGTTAPSVAPENDSGHARTEQSKGTPTSTEPSRAPGAPGSAKLARAPGEPGQGQMERAVPHVDKIFADAAKTLACQSDAECTITCKRDGDCCPELCGCSQPMNKSSLEELTAHLTKMCGPSPICPMTMCAGLKRYIARCEQGLCTAHAAKDSG